jgi:hypothetical protein
VGIGTVCTNLKTLNLKLTHYRRLRPGAIVGVREHLGDRMRERAISIADLNQLRLWIASKPEVPKGDWYKDFGSFKICGHGSFPKTFLLHGQAAKGEAV